MEIFFNGKKMVNSDNIITHMITFNHIPTVLYLKGAKGSGYPNYHLTVNNTKTSLDGTEYVKFGNSVLTPSLNIEDCVNNVFYLAPSSTDSNKKLMAYYLAKALNSTIESVGYDIYSDGNEVYIRSKAVGITLETLETNITNFFNKQSNTTTTENELDNCKIMINIFKNDNYVTTLEKNVINSECKFDLSSIFATKTEDGVIEEATLSVYKVDDTNNEKLFEMLQIYPLNGYSVNRGKMFLTLTDGLSNYVFLQNVSRGDNKITSNNTLLYIYEPKLVFTLATIGKNLPSKTITIKYIDSIFNEIATESKTVSGSSFYNCEYELNTSNFNKASYIDVVLPTNQTIRYNIIKPLKYASEVIRIYWYNSYGGISFFDFVGGKTEERKTEKETYKESALNIYDTKHISLNKVYSNELDYEIKLKTHMMDKDGIYPLYDLLNSYHSWIKIDDEEHDIIITDLSINETQNTNIYQGEITFTYSSNDIFH